MVKKIKIKDKNIFKLFESDISSIQLTGYDGTRHKKTLDEIEELRQRVWDSIMDKKRALLEDIYKRSDLHKAIWKISPAKMNMPIQIEVFDMATLQKKIETLPAPSEIISLAESIRDTAMQSSEYGILLKRFDKPIIWTLNNLIDTAASDGVRIAFNVVFACKLLELGKAALDDYKKAGNKVRNAVSARLMVGKYFLFVYIHEVYHELYRHSLLAERKKETAGGKMHDMANTAMDCEINRDIENQFTELRGSTDAINGCIDPDFPTEPWDVIFDAYYYNHKQMPKHEMPNMPGMPSSGQPQRTNIDDDDNQNNLQQSGNQGQSQSNNSNKQDQQDNSGNQDPQNNKSQQNSQENLPQSRSALDESEEYAKAYNDELQKISDEMNGKKSQKNDPVDLSPEEIENIALNIKDQLAAGMSMSDIIKNGSSLAQSQDSVKLSDKSMRDLMNSLGDVMSEMSDEIKQQALSELSDMSQNAESDIAKQAREQARKDVLDAMNQMESEAEQAAESGDNSTQAGKGDGPVPLVSTSSTFGGADMLSKEELSKIAEECGLPYTAEELTTDRNQVNEDYIKDNLEKIKGVNSALGLKVENISNKLKDLVYLANWKAKLKKFLKNQTEGDPERVRSKKVMSQLWRDDRYVPYKNRTKRDEIGAADVFYLIDNSGSMWGAGFGEGIFLQIFKEIVGIERSCNIELSALTYFSGTADLPKDRIRLWDKKTSETKVLSMIGLTEQDASGGTDIGGNVVAVTKLGKPYYYNTGEKHTLIIVFTDGEDPSQFALIRSIPARYKKDLLFCLINNKSSLLNLIEQYKKQAGVKLSNIIAIATDEYKNKKR